MLLPLDEKKSLLGSPLALPGRLVNWPSGTGIFAKAQPKTLSKINTASTDSDPDDDDNVGGNCDFCSVRLGPKAEIWRRFFRCLDCGSCILCDTCMHDLHISKQAHHLEEWNTTTQRWIATKFADTGLHARYATHCSSCCEAINKAGERMPSRTLMCCECGDGVLCKACCIENHASKPLHFVQSWNGCSWDKLLLKDIGFVYQMGHDGRACAQSETAVSSLLVLDICGPVSIRYIDMQIGFDGQDAARSQVTGDRGIFISNNGECQIERLDNISLKKRRFRLNPGALDDVLALWVPVADGDDDSLDLEKLDSISGGSSTDGDRGTKKRKFYKNSDNPMSLFPEVQQTFLNETLRHHGLGYSCSTQKCAVCECVVGVEKKRFFRCSACGYFLQCQKCCVERHRCTPLHFLEEWNGKFWV
ncbi:hypothetical protein C8R45DRAFT_1096639 [Mycena sanguinolenta]|nr:hypothetical protein C8R45DRAFT_1096639 [Mycena sanguinolenta]